MKNKAVAVYANDGVEIENNSTNIKIGDNSYGFVILDNGVNNYKSGLGSKFTMGSRSLYLYKNGISGNAESKTYVTTDGLGNTAFFANNNGIIKNSGKVDFSKGFWKCRSICYKWRLN